MLDPVCGTGTSMLAALKCGRNSVGMEIDEEYCQIIFNRLRSANQSLSGMNIIEYLRSGDNGGGFVREEEAAYKRVRKRGRVGIRKDNILGYFGFKSRYKASPTTV